MTVKYTVFYSPIGALFLVATDNGLCHVSLAGRKPTSFLRQFQKRHGLIPLRNDAALTPYTAWLSRYFRGEPTRFQGAVHFLRGTPLQKRIWTRLRDIPYGEVRSYTWLAERTGIPHGWRAAGAACGANPLPLFLPCHRVVRSDGSLGGYTGGMRKKIRLLRLEKQFMPRSSGQRRSQC